MTQHADGGALIHITDSDVEDGISYGAGDIRGDKELNLENVIKFSVRGGGDSSTDNDHLTVGKIGSTGGDTNFLNQLANVAILDGDADGSGSVVDFGDFWTNDGDITINTGMDGFNSGIGNIGRLTAQGKITVADTSPIMIMGSMGQWTADGDITISSPVTTGGDWDGIRAGDPEDTDINGRLVIGDDITVGGSMPYGLWADGGGATDGMAEYSIVVGGSAVVVSGTMGDIYGQYGISLFGDTPEAAGSISADSFGNITVDNGVILGTDKNTEFTANSSGYRVISVTNLDADHDYADAVGEADPVRTPPADTMATDMPLLSNVIFLSTSGSGFGDISLNQGTDSQSIATASSAATAAGLGVGFATAGSIGNIEIFGTSGVTLMASGTDGGLFFMAGDDNGPAARGTSGDNTDVAIESLTIELDLTTDGTFGAANEPGALFTVTSGVSAKRGGKYVSGTAGQLLDGAATNVSTTGARGTIGLISLNDIAVGSTSGLARTQGISVGGPTSLVNAAVIIADVGVEVQHLRHGDLNTTLNLSSDPSVAIFHGGGHVAAINSSQSDLVILIL